MKTQQINNLIQAAKNKLATAKRPTALLLVGNGLPPGKMITQGNIAGINHTLDQIKVLVNEKSEFSTRKNEAYERVLVLLPELTTSKLNSVYEHILSIKSVY